MIVDLSPVSAGTRLWAARRTVEQHAEAPSDDRATGSCRHCQPGGGCQMLAWALAVVETRQADGWFVDREAPEETGPGPTPAHDGYYLGSRRRSLT